MSFKWETPEDRAADEAQYALSEHPLGSIGKIAVRILHSFQIAPLYMSGLSTVITYGPPPVSSIVREVLNDPDPVDDRSTFPLATDLKEV